MSCAGKFALLSQQKVTGTIFMLLKRRGRGNRGWSYRLVR